MQKIQNIQVEQVKAREYALRGGVDDEADAELAKSIGRIGLLVPLVVTGGPDIFDLVAGHRRLQACKQAGMLAVPCIVKKRDVAQAREASFAENLFRKDLSAVEVAAGVKDILDQGQMTAEQIAVAVQKSKDWVGRMVAMLAWPGDVLAAIHEGWLSVSAANSLALVHDDTYREFLLKNGRENGVTARTTAAWLQAWRSYQPPEEAIQAEPIEGSPTPTPMVPQAPCLGCSGVFRTDELSHVPVCAQCIRIIREAVASR